MIDSGTASKVKHRTVTMYKFMHSKSEYLSHNPHSPGNHSNVSILFPHPYLPISNMCRGGNTMILLQLPMEIVRTVMG